MFLPSFHSNNIQIQADERTQICSSSFFLFVFFSSWFCSCSKRKQFDFEQCRRKKLRWSISWWSKFNTLLRAVLISALFIFFSLFFSSAALTTHKTNFWPFSFSYISAQWNGIFVYAIAIMDNSFFLLLFGSSTKITISHALGWLVCCTFSIYSFVCWAKHFCFCIISLRSLLKSNIFRKNYWFTIRDLRANKMVFIKAFDQE